MTAGLMRKQIGNIRKEKRDTTARRRFETPLTSRRWNLWTINPKDPDEENAHPATFPLVLAKDHVTSWSNPGDVVLDPFSGSGTTCKAAKELNRQWCGIEINPEYCKIAEARLAQDVLQLETCHE